MVQLVYIYIHCIRTHSFSFLASFACVFQIHRRFLVCSFMPVYRCLCYSFVKSTQACFLGCPNQTPDSPQKIAVVVANCDICFVRLPNTNVLRSERWLLFWICLGFVGLSGLRWITVWYDELRNLLRNLLRDLLSVVLLYSSFNQGSPFFVGMA